MKTAAKFLAALPASLFLTALASIPSQAGSLTYATKVESYTMGTGSVAIDRRIVNEALGAPQLNYDSNQDFLSLGFGGELILSFGTLFSDKVTVWETTWGAKSSQSAYDERAKVYVGNSLTGDWRFIGSILNIANNAYRSADGASLSIGDSNTYRYVRLVDDSPFSRDRDGFDVNAVSVQAAAVPEPTTMAGLALAGAGMAAARRKQQRKTSA